MRITRTEAPRCSVGEGALWDVGEQALFILGISVGDIHRHDPATGETRSWNTGGPVSAMALREAGGAVVALRDGVYALDFESGALELLAARPQDAAASTVFNDGKVDRRGRLVIGSCCVDLDNPQPVGGLYGLGVDHGLRWLAGDIHQSNGPCWSPDDKTFYFADSHRNTSFAYDYDIETGALSNRRPLIDTSELGGGPDGATVDRDGLVWMGIFTGGKVAAFRPDGRLERVVEMPMPMPVSVTFGGPNLDVLYVATIQNARFGFPEDEASGYVYAIEGLGVRGVPEPRYRG